MLKQAVMQWQWPPELMLWSGVRLPPAALSSQTCNRKELHWVRCGPCTYDEQLQCCTYAARPIGYACHKYYLLVSRYTLYTCHFPSCRFLTMTPSRQIDQYTRYHEFSRPNALQCVPSYLSVQVDLPPLFCSISHEPRSSSHARSCASRIASWCVSFRSPRAS